MPLAKHRLDVPPVLDARREDQRRGPIARLPGDLGARALDEHVVIHQVLGLAGDELTSPHMQTAGVCLR